MTRGIRGTYSVAEKHPPPWANPPKALKWTVFDQPRSPFDTGPKTPIQGFRKTPRAGGIRGPAGISHDGFPGFWDSWVLGLQGSPSRSQGNSARSSGQGVPAEAFLRAGFRCPPLGIPARLFRASPRVGRQAGKPAPGQSPPRLSPRTICGNMLHLFTLRNPA